MSTYRSFVTIFGVVAIGLGIALLASYASLQDQIDHHATRSRSDFDDLTTLEDRAQGYAITGDIAIVAGLAAGALGTYYLVRNHRRRVAVGLVPLPHGGGLVHSTVTGGAKVRKEEREWTTILLTLNESA